MKGRVINTGHTATFRCECEAKEAFYVLTIHSTANSIMFETKKRRIHNWQGGPGPPSLGEHKRCRPLLSLSGIHKDKDLSYHYQVFTRTRIPGNQMGP